MKFFYLLLFTLLASQNAFSESRSQHARKCEAAIGAKIPGFNCLSGSIVPMNGVTGSGKCPKSPLLGGHGCHKNARTGRIQTNNPDVDIQFLCRHYNNNNSGANDPKFHDIAMIARNVKNGATCFFQTNVGSRKNASNVPAPSQGSSFWQSPSEVAEGTCVRCHDADPFIRSPYLMQVKDRNALPFRRNQSTHYWFPGSDFTSWQAFWVQSSRNNGCNHCHKMGSNNKNSNTGSSGQLGAYSAGRQRFGLDSSGDVWMNRVPNSRPGPAFDEMKRCAQNHSASGCQVTKRTKGGGSNPPPTPGRLKWALTPNSSYSLQAGGSIHSIIFKATGMNGIKYTIGHPQNECRWDKFRSTNGAVELYGSVPSLGQAFTTNGATVKRGQNICRVTLKATAGGTTISSTVEFRINAGSGGGGNSGNSLQWNRFPSTQNLRVGQSINLVASVSGGQARYTIGHPSPECSWDRPRQVGNQMNITGTVPFSGRYTTNGLTLRSGLNTCHIIVVATRNGRSTSRRFTVNITK
jgi:hypothetical protein